PKTQNFIIPTKTENQKQKPKIPSFPRQWESGSFGFACFKFRVTSTSSFPRRRESGALSFSYLE
ncbi:TPA: hypothetical protein ACFJHD_002310, partial [Neisseria gonorrhoeae]